MSDVLAEQYAEAVCRRAGEVVTELSQASPLDPTLLRSTKTIFKACAEMARPSIYPYFYFLHVRLCTSKVTMKAQKC